jgi:hypothetical protein
MKYFKLMNPEHAQATDIFRDNSTGVEYRNRVGWVSSNSVNQWVDDVRRNRNKDIIEISLKESDIIRKSLGYLIDEDDSMMDALIEGLKRADPEKAKEASKNASIQNLPWLRRRLMPLYGPEGTITKKNAAKRKK